jgi:hypothetical protein
VIRWVREVDMEGHLMKVVHEELANFFDVVNEREFREIQAHIPQEIFKTKTQ